MEPRQLAQLEDGAVVERWVASTCGICSGGTPTGSVSAYATRCGWSLRLTRPATGSGRGGSARRARYLPVVARGTHAAQPASRLMLPRAGATDLELAYTDLPFDFRSVRASWRGDSW